MLDTGRVKLANIEFIPVMSQQNKGFIRVENLMELFGDMVIIVDVLLEAFWVVYQGYCVGCFLIQPLPCDTDQALVLNDIGMRYVCPE